MASTASLTTSPMKPRLGAHWDASLKHFHPSPTGPYEGEPEVHDGATAHAHFCDGREIKLRDPRCELQQSNSVLMFPSAVA